MYLTSDKYPETLRRRRILELPQTILQNFLFFPQSLQISNGKFTRKYPTSESQA